jgi:hypothetical protein
MSEHLKKKKRIKNDVKTTFVVHRAGFDEWMGGLESNLV